MIEEAAYYLALANETASPERDWLAAEQSIDAMLQEQATQPP